MNRKLRNKDNILPFTISFLFSTSIGLSIKNKFHNITEKSENFYNLLIE